MKEETGDSSKQQPTPKRGPGRQGEPIAIVGMACNFPGAPDLPSFWRLLEGPSKFRSLEQFSEFLPYIPAFQHMVPGAHELMAKSTLRQSSMGKGYELRCPPEYEAQIIDYAPIFSLAIDFDAMLCPMKVIGADPTLPFSYLPTLDLSDVATVDHDFLPDATHFLPLEKPDECAATMLAFLSQLPIRSP